MSLFSSSYEAFPGCRMRFDTSANMENGAAQFTLKMPNSSVIFRFTADEFMDMASMFAEVLEDWSRTNPPFPVEDSADCDCRMSVDFLNGVGIMFPAYMMDCGPVCTCPDSWLQSLKSEDFVVPREDHKLGCPRYGYPEKSHNGKA